MSPPVKTFMHIEQYSCIILLDKARICVHPKKNKKMQTQQNLFFGNIIINVLKKNSNLIRESFHMIMILDCKSLNLLDNQQPIVFSRMID